MKNLARRFVVTVLGWQVRRLCSRNNFRIVAIAGSIGKTSTKLAIASVLQRKYKVQFQNGNYNDLVSVPLIFFGQAMPNLLNPFAWLRVFIKNEKILRRQYPYDVVVVELGVDGPGQLRLFHKYLTVDIGVLTAIAPEHMEYFKDLDEVAEEEMNLAALSKQLIVNGDFCPPKYVSQLEGEFISYGKYEKSDYRITDVAFKKESYDFKIKKQGDEWLSGTHAAVAETQLHSLCASAVVADLLELTAEQIVEGFKAIKPVSGRMQHLNGIKGSIILDDSYNASPEATRAALDTLYKFEAPQRIAVLGNMNELGSYSAEAHTEIGKHCDPKQVDLVITIGPDANTYLATAARNNGCEVHEAQSPYQAGQLMNEQIKNGAIILVKGSQNGVFSEEAIKSILTDPADEVKLVRQSPHWLKIKAKQFKNH